MTATITDIRTNALELAKGLTKERILDLNKEVRSLTAYLEEEDDTQYDGELAKLDGFQRFLAVNGIRTRSNPAAGIRAMSARDLLGLKTDGNPELGKVLFTEFKRRVVADAFLGTRAPSVSLDDYTSGGVLRGYQDDTVPRAPGLAPAIPIAELIALDTASDSDAVRAVYYNDEPAQVRRVRVGEEGMIPKAKLRAATQTVHMFKYGRGIEVTYETLAFQPLDMVAFFLARAAIQTQIDQVSGVIDTMVLGDGNANAATVDTRLGLDPAATTAGTLTLRVWLAWKFRFANPYTLTHVLAPEDAALQLMLLNIGTPNATLAEAAPNLGAGGVNLINPELSRTVRLGVTSDAPAMKYVGFDSRFAIQRVYAPAMDIEETVRWADRQTQVLYTTIMEGFVKLDKKAVRILDLT